MSSVPSDPLEIGFDVYAGLDTTRTPAEIAACFARAGWTAHRCTWVDWEVCSDVAELIIENTTPPLLHGRIAGPVADLPRVLEPLVAAGIRWTAECYDDENRLIHEQRG